MADVTRLSAREARIQDRTNVAAKPSGILVVDDEPNICAVFADALVRHNYRVRTCTSGEEAIQLASNESFDAVFIDVMMPGMNGLQVLKVLRKRLPRAIFIMITGYPDSGLVDGSLASGAFLCLSKPVSLEDVVDLLNDISGDGGSG